jgi:rod shape-determining protein MreC
MIASTRRTQGALRPFFVLFGIAVFLLLARETPPIVAAQSIASRALVPFEAAVSGAGAAVAGLFGSIAELEQLRGDNTQLRGQVETLQLENVRLREQVAAMTQVANLQGIAASLPYKTITSQVIARDPAGFVRTLTIDAGTDQGVAVGDVVVAEQGLVGRVTAIFPTYARVLPITDSGSSIVATVQRSRASGIVHGVFGETLSLEWVLQTEQIAPGDVVITAGLALNNEVRSLYPKGLVIGTVVDVQKADVQAYQKAVVTPAVDFRKLERVLVIKAQ